MLLLLFFLELAVATRLRCTVYKVSFFSQCQTIKLSHLLREQTQGKLNWSGLSQVNSVLVLILFGDESWALLLYSAELRARWSFFWPRRRIYTLSWKENESVWDDELCVFITGVGWERRSVCINGALLEGSAVAAHPVVRKEQVLWSWFCDQFYLRNVFKTLLFQISCQILKVEPMHLYPSIVLFFIFLIRHFWCEQIPRNVSCSSESQFGAVFESGRL